MTKRPKTPPPPTPAEWGMATAKQAPEWSDKTWRAACASLGIATTTVTLPE